MNFKYLFLSKWLLLCSFLGAILYLNIDYVKLALSNDMVATPVILIVSAIFFLVGTYRAIEFSRDLNTIKKYICITEKFDVSTSALEYRYYSKTSLLSYLSTLPVLLGIFGTITGLISVGGEVYDTVQTIKTVQDALLVFGQFMDGAMLAFYSTGSGIVASIILSFFMVLIRNAVSEIIVEADKRRY